MSGAPSDHVYRESPWQWPVHAFLLFVAAFFALMAFAWTGIDRAVAVTIVVVTAGASGLNLGSRRRVVIGPRGIAISGVLPKEEAIEQIKKAIKKTYGKKGEEVVRKNFAAVDATLENLHEVELGTRAVSEIAMLPPVGNALVVLLKGTSIASIITVPELTAQSTLIVTRTFAVMQVFTCVLALYYMIAMTVTWFVRLLERRLGRWRPQTADIR